MGNKQELGWLVLIHNYRGTIFVPFLCMWICASCLPLTREVDFAKQKTEGENVKIILYISPSASFLLGSSLVRGSRAQIAFVFVGRWIYPRRGCVRVN